MPKKTHYNAKIRTGKDQNFTSFELSSPQVGEMVAQSDPISHKSSLSPPRFAARRLGFTREWGFSSEGLKAVFRLQF